MLSVSLFGGGDELRRKGDKSGVARLSQEVLWIDRWMDGWVAQSAYLTVIYYIPNYLPTYLPI